MGGAGVARRAVNAVSRLVAVNRLKEIMVLKGFQRAGGERLTPPDLTGEGNWLPALELYGEGIFFTLDEASLQRWEGGGALQERADAFSRRYLQRAGQGVPEFDVEVSPRFLLCHTLAHLLDPRARCGSGIPRRLAEGAHLLRDRQGAHGRHPDLRGGRGRGGFPGRADGAGEARSLPPPADRSVRGRGLVLAGPGLLGAGRTWAGPAEPSRLPRLRARAGDELPLWQRPPRPGLRQGARRRISPRSWTLRGRPPDAQRQPSPRPGSSPEARRRTFPRSPRPGLRQGA